MRPERFALGAAIGCPKAAISACATACAGLRTATDVRPPTESAEIELRRLKIIASGPGQNASASLSARLSQPMTASFAIATPETCAMSGFDDGRRFMR